MAEEGDRRHDHQADLDDLNALNQERLFVLICELTGNRRKKEKWQDEECTGDVCKLAGVESEDLHALECDQNDQTIAKNVVVEGS